MGNFLKVLLSLIMQSLMGYLLALYVIHLLDTPEEYQALLAGACNVIGIWGMGFFLEGLNNHLEGIHIIARFFAALFGAFIGVIIVAVFGSTHWLEIPIIPLVLALMGYHFIFFIRTKDSPELPD